jgi:hypothetical protein
MALVNTTYGEMDESLLEKKEGTFEDDNELTTWVEYWKGEELVHRSAHVTLKKTPAFMGGEITNFV